MSKQLLFYSRTGLTGEVAERYNGTSIDNYDGESEYVLLFPTWGSARTGNYVPKPVTEFLSEHGHRLRAVIGLGNMNFGRDFCRGALEVSKTYNVPCLTEIDVVPTQSQDRKLKELFCPTISTND